MGSAIIHLVGAKVVGGPVFVPAEMYGEKGIDRCAVTANAMVENKLQSFSVVFNGRLAKAAAFLLPNGSTFKCNCSVRSYRHPITRENGELITRSDGSVVTIPSVKLICMDFNVMDYPMPLVNAGVTLWERIKTIFNKKRRMYIYYERQRQAWKEATQNG